MVLQTWNSLWQRRKEELKNYKFMIRPVIILAVVYLVAISAMIRANFYYVDDLGRAKQGYAGWDNFSRYLSVFLSYVLHADTYLTDISPLPQVIAVFIIALAGVIALHVISDAKQFSFWHIIAAIPMGLSPYFLGCLSYKYDSPYMALSVLFSVFPLLLYKGNWITYFLSTVCCAIGMCTTYQASAGIFPMLVIMVGIMRWVRNDELTEIMKFIAISAVSYLAGLLIFWKFLMADHVDYASTTLAPLAEFIPNAITNYKLYIMCLICGFKLEWLILFLVICATYIYVIITRSKRNKIVTVGISILSLVVLFALSFGVYPFLTTPLFMPRCMYGVGCFLAFLGMYILTTAPKVYPAKLACLFLSWAFFVFSFTYGNALYAQSTYTNYRITAAIDDLVDSDVLFDGDAKTVRITGTIGFAPVIENLPNDYFLLYWLVPITFSEEAYWGSYGFINYYGIPDCIEDQISDPSDKDLPLVADNIYHTIRSDGEYIWIDLHGELPELSPLAQQLMASLGIA